MICISNKIIYNLTDTAIGKTTIVSSNRCPTMIGHLFHTVLLFILLLIIIIINNKINNKLSNSLKYAFYGMILYFIIANPFFYKITSLLTNKITTDLAACPSNKGLILHSIIYFLVILSIMVFTH
jgi:hypothetical protein